MALSIALDELRATGWSGLDSTGCAFDEIGRAYPTVRRVRQEFAAGGFDLSLERLDAFDCYRAEWREPGAAEPAGSTISRSQDAAAVYALAQWRRSLAAATA